MAKFTSDNQPSNKGRKKGAVNKLPVNIIEALPDIIEIVKNQALSGDMQACTLILKHALPTIKPTERPFVLQLPYTASNTEILNELKRLLIQGVINHQQSREIREELLAISWRLDNEERKELFRL